MGDMTFVYPALLAGLVLVGIPVLLHLIMQQKPKRLPFPAVRFLLARQRVNQRRLRLRHLLLLALRMLLIALACLALARPKIFSERLNLSADRPVAAALLFDTSFSMQYGVGGQNRLDEAKRRALELLDSLPDGSRIAVFDSAESGGEWLPSASASRDRIGGLELRPANYPVTNQLAAAYELLAKLDEEVENPDEMPLRFVYVFSDRTEGSWNAAHQEQLQRLRDRVPPPGVAVVLVDVGVKEPTNVAVAGLNLPQQIVPANRPVVIEATVQALGARCDTEVACRIDGKDLLGKEQVVLEPGQSRVYAFKGKGLPTGLHHAEVALANPQALPFSGVRYATFEVQGPRKVLIVSDDPRNAVIIQTALESGRAFACDVKSTAEMRNVFPKDLAAYRAVVLLGLARPDADLWEKLARRYVPEGGGLAVVPGGNQVEVDAYNSPVAQAVMPAELVKVSVSKSAAGAVWSTLSYPHPLMARLGDLSKEENVDFLAPGQEPGAFRFWEVRERPGGETDALAAYEESRPALLERRFDPKQGVRGRVLLFTTPLDDAHVAGRDGAARDQPRWNNYLQGSSFYLVLAQTAVGYLAGDTQGGNLNYTCGQSVPIPLPGEPRFPTYTVQGPGLSAAEAVLTRAQNQGELQITKAMAPGNYRVFGADGKPLAGFSLNVAPEESMLTPVPAEKIEALFGPDAILPLDQKASLPAALQNHWSQPVELLPWLMIFVLVFLAVENLLANKFYRRSTEEPGPSPAEPQGGDSGLS
jgi:hypothetical protein